jgi:hypothetical protein
MKHDETQAYALDIPRQCSARKIQPMNTQTFTLNKPNGLQQRRFWPVALGALLLCAGAVQAAEPQQMATSRPLDLSLPRDASALPAWRSKQAIEHQSSKPYGSGYESRGLGESGKSGADETLLPPSRATGNGSARGGGAGAGGGSGGSGGRGR